jgi:hypothetical protein
VEVSLVHSLSELIIEADADARVRCWRLLSSVELQNTVKLPEGEDLNEWIAVNTVSRGRQMHQDESARKHC